MDRQRGQRVTRSASTLSTASELGCRMERLAGFIVRTKAAMDELTDNEADIVSAETLAPAWSDFWQKTPPTGSMAGAVAALKAMLLSDALDECDERVLLSVLGFLDGGGDA